MSSAMKKVQKLLTALTAAALLAVGFGTADLFVILLTIYKCHYIIEAAKGLGGTFTSFMASFFIT